MVSLPIDFVSHPKIPFSLRSETSETGGSVLLFCEKKFCYVSLQFCFEAKFGDTLVTTVLARNRPFAPLGFYWIPTNCLINVYHPVRAVDQFNHWLNSTWPFFARKLCMYNFFMYTVYCTVCHYCILYSVSLLYTVEEVRNLYVYYANTINQIENMRMIFFP